MKKENFIALLLGTVTVLLFALGMCMCLLREWKAFNAGVVFVVVGLVGIIVTVVVYLKMTGKKFVKPNKKTVGKVIYGIFSVLVFGVGMCMALVWKGMMIPGILVGILGIVLILLLIPMCIGINSK